MSIAFQTRTGFKNIFAFFFALDPHAFRIKPVSDLNLSRVSTHSTVLIVIDSVIFALNAMFTHNSATYSVASDNPIEPITKPNSRRRDMLLQFLVLLSTLSSGYLRGKNDTK